MGPESIPDRIALPSPREPPPTPRIDNPMAMGFQVHRTIRQSHRDGLRGSPAWDSMVMPSTFVSIASLPRYRTLRGPSCMLAHARHPWTITRCSGADVGSAPGNQEHGSREVSCNRPIPS